MKKIYTPLLVILVLFELNAQDNVGIGTTTPNPNSILELVSSDKGFLMTRLNSADTSVIGNSGINTGMMFYASDVGQFMFYDGTKWESLSIGTNYWGSSGNDIYNLNSGNIGFGTSNPLYDLHMEGNTYSMRLKSTQSTGAAATEIYFGRDNGGGGFQTTGFINDPGSGDYLQIGSPFFLQFNTNFAARMTIDNAGNVGIGVTGPSARLDVDGSIRFRSLGGNGDQIVVVDNNGDLDTVSLANTLLWGVTGDDIYNLNSGGVAIGGPSTTLKFQVTDITSGTNPTMAVSNSDGSGDVGYGMGNSGSGQSYVIGIDGSDGDLFKISNGGSLGTNDRITIEQSGNVGIGINANTIYRLYNFVPNTNSTTPYGIYNSHNYVGAGTKYGIYNLVSTDGTGTKYGQYNDIIQPAGEASPMVGVYNNLNHDGTGAVYGVYNSALGAATSGNIYGIYNTGEDYNYFSGFVGIGATIPVNRLDVEGGVAIGSSYSGSIVAPSNGMIVQGNVGIGNNAPDQSLVVGDPQGAGWIFPAVTVGSAASGGAVQIGSSTNFLSIDASNTFSRARFRVTDAGGVGQGDLQFLVGGIGINEAAPLNELDVNGSVVIGASYAGSNTAQPNGLAVEGGVGIGTTGSSNINLYTNIPTTNTTKYYGIYNYNGYNGGVSKYGIANFVTSQGTGTKYGTYNGVSQPSGEASVAYGVYNSMNHDGTGNVYGVYNTMAGSATTGTVYGTYNTGEDMNYFSGNMGIGTTSSTYKFQILGNYFNDIAEIYNNNTGTNADGLRIRVGTATPGSFNYMLRFLNGGGSQIGSVSGNGGGGVNFNTSSDRRLKTNIVDLENGLDLISRMRPRRYEFKSVPGLVQEGFIAQEMLEVMPRIVSGGPESDPNVDPMGIDYGQLTPVLTAGIQELYEMMLGQQEEIEKLKLENQKLRTELGLDDNK